jgi:hypothetical protein
MHRLSIGAGRDQKPGWKCLDADPTHRPDFVATVPPLPEAVKQICWHEIEMIHVIEHFYPWQADELLREIFDILQPGGLLVLEQPNIAYCARVLLGLETPPAGASGQFDMWGLYGDPTQHNPLMGHHWGYRPETLTEMLVTARFEREKIEIRPAQHHRPVRDFRIEASK